MKITILENKKRVNNPLFDIILPCFLILSVASWFHLNHILSSTISMPYYTTIFNI